MIGLVAILYVRIVGSLFKFRPLGSILTGLEATSCVLELALPLAILDRYLVPNWTLVVP